MSTVPSFNPSAAIKSLVGALGNSTFQKNLGLVLAGFGAFKGPGIATKEQNFVTLAGLIYSLVVHVADSIWNSAPGTPPTA